MSLFLATVTLRFTMWPILTCATSCDFHIILSQTPASDSGAASSSVASAELKSEIRALQDQLAGMLTDRLM